MDPVVQALLDRTGRWPASWKNPSEQEIKQGLKKVILLIRDVTRKGEKLFAIDQSKLDIYNTDITNLTDTSWGPEEVKGLKVSSLWYGRVPIGNHYAGDPHITVEDVIANLGEFKLGTLVEVWTSGIKIDFDGEHPEFGDIWRPIFITYVRER